MAKFRTKARAIDLLGKNQIADLPTAITEIWKNGYDAYGDLLEANFYEKGYDEDLKNHIFTISDDGHGMTNKDLLNKWIVLGTDNKKNSNFNTPIEDRLGKEQRIPLGEKGIGRLSIAYLGQHMLMITKKENQPFELLFMNWKVLDNLDLYLDDISIPIKTIGELDSLNIHYNDLIEEYKENLNNNNWNNHVFVKENLLLDLDKYSKFPEFLKTKIIKKYIKDKHGTMFIIFDPIDELFNLSNEDPTDQSEHSKHIRTSITALFNPFDKELLEKRERILGEEVRSPIFNFHKKNKEHRSLIKYNDFFTRDEFENCEHWIKGEFNVYGEFNGVIKSYGKTYDYSWYPIRKKTVQDYGIIKLELAFFEGKRQNSIMTDEQYILYEKKSNEFGGLYVYRDGFRVLPYGRTDFDFLEFELRRSKRAGSSYFSHRKMFGYIGISKENNNKLIDKSGREGFVSNTAYRELKQDLINFFTKISKDYYGTEAESRQKHLTGIKNKKNREMVIEEEEERNKKELKEFRKELKEKEKEIETISVEIKELMLELNTKTKNKLFAVNEKNLLLKKINIYKNRVARLEVRKPNRLEIRDTDINKIYEQHQKVENLKNILTDYNDEVIKNTYINELQDFYRDKYNEICNNLVKSSTDYSSKIKKFSNKLEELYNEKKLKNFKIIEEFAPSNIDIENISKEKTNEYLKNLEDTFKIINIVNEEKIFPVIDYLKNINFEFNDEEKIEAYKSKYSELEKKVEALHELAQLGMAVEIIDHQFNVLYSQISDSLRYFNSYINKNNNDAIFNYRKLKESFEHLETNHKLLVPLYRTMRKSKKNIYGKDIEETILRFFDKQFKENGIKINISEEFKAYYFYNYESVINPVFINIIHNAVFWLRTKDIKEIDIRLNHKEEIIIANSGEKMKYTDLNNCFDLFFTNRPGGRGIGLYLAKTNLRTVGMDIYSTDDTNYNILDGACFVICKYNKEGNE